MMRSRGLAGTLLLRGIRGPLVFNPCTAQDPAVEATARSAPAASGAHVGAQAGSPCLAPWCGRCHPARSTPLGPGSAELGTLADGRVGALLCGASGMFLSNPP